MNPEPGSGIPECQDLFGKKPDPKSRKNLGKVSFIIFSEPPISNLQFSLDIDDDMMFTTKVIYLHLFVDVSELVRGFKNELRLLLLQSPSPV